jgi:hypothetical protein
MMGSIIQQIVWCQVQSSGSKRLSGLRALRCTVTFGSPNKSLQRSGTHKLLGRGRPSVERTRALRARVLEGRRAAAELSR